MKTKLWLLVAMALVATNLCAQNSIDAKAQLKLIDAVMPSLVQVEIQLQHDKGELPAKSGWGEKCPNCGKFHSSGIEDLVKNEQPLASSGFLISEKQVVATDIQTHSRFIKSIQVRKGEKLISAKIVSYAVGQNAVILELDQPLSGAKPLKFEAQKSGPFLAVQYQPLNGEWNVSIKPFSELTTVRHQTGPFVAAETGSLLIDKSGTPVGILMNDELPVNSSWKGSPVTAWKLMDAAKMQEALVNLATAADSGVVRVKLNFRSPKPAGNNDRFNSFRDSDDADNQTERNVTGLIVGGNRVLILVDLKPKVTARLQRISVFGGDGKSVPAKFEFSLKDYGALVATLETPVEKSVNLSAENILKTRNELLLAADISVKGEKRVAYYFHGRIASFNYGWRNQVYPEIADKEEVMHLFNLENELVAFPVSHREKGPAPKYSRDEEKVLTASSYIRAILENSDTRIDPANVPLSEEDENRLAWMGIELQAMNAQLARVNQVSEYTRDGEVGAMVTHVYPGSPAAEAGIETGYILLRLQTDENPTPIEIELEENSFSEAFPWDRLDEVQDRYFERIPMPWPSVENVLTRQLTDLGIGKDYVAEFFHDGKIVEKKFTVAAGPLHYQSAPRHKTDALGLTVRDLTYEVRRYLQRREDEPGVVISKIEPGSRAAVSGIKPYEVITHINDNPVKNVKDFEALVSKQGELNIAVKRMAKGRLVKIAPPAAKE